MDPTAIQTLIYIEKGKKRKMIYLLCEWWESLLITSHDCVGQVPVEFERNIPYQGKMALLLLKLLQTIHFWTGFC